MTPASEHLGLSYGTVFLAPYTEAWKAAFTAVATESGPVLGQWSGVLEHVGSTAVPGLLAKPILDVAVGVPVQAHVAHVIAALQGRGYIYRGDAGSEGGHILVRESSPRVRTHHLHVVHLTDPQWSDYLVLRDLLRADADEREAYADLKSDLALKHATDRRAYSRAKAAFVQRLLDRARSQRAKVVAPAP